MKRKIPILLSFYGLSNGTRNLFFGKLAYSPVSDLNFKKFNRLKTFKTIFALYRTKGIRHTAFEMQFDQGSVQAQTDHSGAFWCEAEMQAKQTKLVSITLSRRGEKVRLTEELYPNRIHHIDTHTIVISDLDDTLIHSFIRNKIHQVRTLLFTTVEKRKAVKDMAHLIKRFALSGAIPFYVSNSEQNLYPLLYRFLNINEFPEGPIFLKQYIRMRDLLLSKLLGKKNPHKVNTIGRILELFPHEKYILIGDNTQHDLAIYLKVAELHPENIRYIIIRKVHEKEEDEHILFEAEKKLRQHNIGLYYATSFPTDLPLNL